MTAEDLYSELKNALRALDLQWCDKDLVNVTLKDGSLRFRYNGRSYEVVLPTDSKE